MHFIRLIDFFLIHSKICLLTFNECLLSGRDGANCKRYTGKKIEKAFFSKMVI